MRWIVFLLLAGCALPTVKDAPRVAPASAAPIPTTPAPVSSAAPVPIWAYDVVARYPHDTRAFTQGLLIHKGELWESTGQRGQSSLRRVQLDSGKPEVLATLPKEQFGEGLAVSGGRFFWLTWDTGLCHVYNEAIQPVQTFRYQGEGWGLCPDPQGNLWMSNGSDKLVLRDPKTFRPLREIQVRAGGAGVSQLNELEWVEGRIYANLWGSNQVAVIDPQDGQVEAFIDFAGLLSAAEAAPPTDVLNGIAYNPASHKLWITGKYWPRLFEVKVRP